MAKTVTKDNLHNAAVRVRNARGTVVNLPVVGSVRVPPPERWVYYGTLAALAAAEIIEWPIALILGAGHLLIDNQHSQLAEEIGEALEEA
jgi:hypothetical protein